MSAYACVWIDECVCICVRRRGLVRFIFHTNLENYYYICTQTHARRQPLIHSMQWVCVCVNVAYYESNRISKIFTWKIKKKRLLVSLPLMRRSIYRFSIFFPRSSLDMDECSSLSLALSYFLERTITLAHTLYVCANEWFNLCLWLWSSRVFLPLISLLYLSYWLHGQNTDFNLHKYESKTNSALVHYVHEYYPFIESVNNAGNEWFLSALPGWR